MLRWLRRLLLLLVIVAIFAALAFLVTTEDRGRNQEIYMLRVTAEIQTAVANALFDATRTAEGSLSQYRLVTVGPDERLADVATRYHTTLDVLYMANGLLSDVVNGDGSTLVVPEGVQFLDPPRRFQVHTAAAGDTLVRLATFYNVSFETLKQDNPVLAGRDLIPGDLVFIPIALTF